MAWEPSASDAHPLSMVEPFFSEVASIVDMASAVIQQEMLCMSTKVDWRLTTDSASCCNLIALISSEQMHITKKLVLAAKRAIMEIMESTGKRGVVRLLGMRRCPFIETHRGFTSTFGNPVTKRQTCQRIYDDGYCRFGQTCCYQHPSLTVSLNFVVALVAPEFGVVAAIPQVWEKQTRQW